jgi:P27 family predicted phage terminase small subunit
MENPAYERSRMPNKAVPTSLKILRGNPGRRRLNRKEPKPALGAEFPAWLEGLGDPDVKLIWGDLAHLLDETKVLTVSDTEALAQLAHKISLYRQAAAALKDGLVYTTITESGGVMQRQKPECAILSDLGKQIRGLLSDFGLTPSSRSKVQTAGDITPDDAFSEFFPPRVSS